MRVQTTITGLNNAPPLPEVVWPEGWPLPSVGDEVDLDSLTVHVRHVVWYPHGDAETAEPFVYLILGRERP